MRRHHNLLTGSGLSGPVLRRGASRAVGGRIGGGVAAGHLFWGVSISATNEEPLSGVGCTELRFFDAAGNCISDGLTGYAKSGWTAINSQTAATKLTDGLTTTQTNSVAYSSGALPFVMWVEFSSPANVALAQIVAYAEVFGAGNPKDFDLVYSDDGVTWTAVATTTDETGWRENEDRTLENPLNPPAWTGQNAFTALNWRFRLEDYHEPLFAWGMSEVLAYDTVDGSPTVPISISSNRTWAEPLTNLIDGDDQTFASDVDNPPTRQATYIELGFASPINLAAIGLRARNGAGDPADIGKQMPNELRVEYLDGATWKYAGYLIDPNPSYAAKGELRRFPLLFAR